MQSAGKTSPDSRQVLLLEINNMGLSVAKIFGSVAFLHVMGRMTQSDFCCLVKVHKCLRFMSVLESPPASSLPGFVSGV